MTVGDAIFTAIFVVAGVAGPFLFWRIRSERVGSLKLRGRIGYDLPLTQAPGPATRVRLTVAKEGGPSAKVQVRTIGKFGLDVERLDCSDALELARLLDSASIRLRRE